VTDADGIDISGMPAPPGDDATDISAMPAPPVNPISAGVQRAYDTAKQYIETNPLTAAPIGLVEAGANFASNFASTWTSGLNFYGGVLGTHGDLDVADAMRKAASDVTVYQPQTVYGKAIAAAPSQLIKKSLEYAEGPEALKKVDAYLRSVTDSDYVDRVYHNMRYVEPGLEMIGSVLGLKLGGAGATTLRDMAGGLAENEPLSGSKDVVAEGLAARRGASTPAREPYEDYMEGKAPWNPAWGPDPKAPQHMPEDEPGPAPANVNAAGNAATPEPAAGAPPAPASAMPFGHPDNPVVTPRGPTSAPVTGAPVGAAIAGSTAGPATGTPAGAAPSAPPTSTSAPEASPAPAGSPQDKFMAAYEAATQPHPTEPAQRRLGNVSVEATRDPFDPNTVHIEKFIGDSASKGQGGKAMQPLTAMADAAGANLKLEAVSQKAADGTTIHQDKLDDFYAAHGFEPADGGEGGWAGPGPGRVRPAMPAEVNSPPMIGLPQEVKVNGQPTKFGPSPAIRTAAYNYVRSAGIPHDPPRIYEAMTQSLDAPQCEDPFIDLAAALRNDGKSPEA